MKSKLMTTMAAAALFVGCGSAPKTDAEFQKEVTTRMQSTLSSRVDDLVAAAQRIQNAAPAPMGRGWDATLDAQSIASMRSAWRDARVAYEHIEGALAPNFPDIDTSIDARYDDFLMRIGPNGDQNLFDD